MSSVARPRAMVANPYRNPKKKARPCRGGLGAKVLIYAGSSMYDSGGVGIGSDML